MATSKSKSSAKQKKKQTSVRFVSGLSAKSAATHRRRSASGASTVKRKAPPKPRSRRPANNAGKRSRIAAITGPGWGELKEFNNERLATPEEQDSGLQGLSTLRFSLAVLSVVILVTLYVGHVYATQNLLTDLQTLRKDKLVMSLEFNALKGEYDRRTGPTVISDRARNLGLKERSRDGREIMLQP